MNFTDLFFLAYFLPGFLVVARLLARGGFALSFRLLLIGTTLIFYGFENASWLWIFAAVILPAYGAAYALSRSQSEISRRLWLAAGVATCLASLGVFKYLNWLALLLPTIAPFQAWVVRGFGEAGLIELPPGISFYVFEAISFQVDVYRRRFAFPRFLDYANFICLFPRFIAGPIVRYTDVSSQIAKWPGMQLHRGLLLFAIGFILKISFADQFAKFVPYAFETVRPDFLQALTGSVAYSFQLYFDFWGYSVMAMGIGLCVGFSFPDNFLRPYAAISITDFWRRWHVTLSSWLRDYLYIPLGGNRRGKWRQYINLLLTMALAGLWHGASIVFVLWGLYHGVLLVIEKLLGVEHVERTLLRRLMRVYCLIAVLVGWVLFRANSLGQAVDVMGGLSGQHGFGPRFNFLFFERHLFALGLVLAGVLFYLFGERKLMTGPSSGLLNREFSAAEAWIIHGCFIFSLLVRFGEDGVPFLYFQF